MRVDLHLHTTASDGALTPTQLIALAAKHGLDIIAITDHDTTEGLSEALQAASILLRPPVIVSGIEISAEDKSGDVHTLGYFVNPQNHEFQNTLSQFREDRQNRAHRIVERLAELGVPVDWNTVLNFANGGAIGRPHIARALIEAGHVSSVKEAFQRYIANDGPAYISRKRMSPEEAIDLIHRAGGVAVLAHPGLLADYVTMVERLIPAGLDGVELVHPKNPEIVRLNLRALAHRYGLIMTGGSDFHGLEDGAPSMGSLTPPPGCTQALRTRANLYVTQQPEA